MEGGKLANPEKNPRSTGETNYNSASHEFRSKLEKQPGAELFKGRLALILG